jgi:hypothetical protein
MNSGPLNRLEPLILLGTTALPVVLLMIRARASAARWGWAGAASLIATGIGSLTWPTLRTQWIASTPYTVNPFIAYTAGLLFFLMLGLIAGILLAPRAPDVIHKRGTRIEEGKGNPYRARRARRTGRITLAGIPLDPFDETKHVKLIGTTGTGKSTAIREILAAALSRGDRAIVADPDGGYAARFYDPKAGDRILNPFDLRSATWDPFGEIAAPYDVEQLARALIPDHEGQERSWRNYARTLLAAVTRQLWELGERDPKVKTIAELYRLLTMASTEELSTLLEGTPAGSYLAGGNERMFGSIRSVTATYVAALEYLSRTTGPPLCIRDWIRASTAHTPGQPSDLRERGTRSHNSSLSLAPSAHGQPSGFRVGQGPTQNPELSLCSPDTHPTRALFLPYSATQIAALRSTISAWLRLAIFETMNGPERAGADPQRLWFVVDELDALGAIDGLKDALARLRKFGGCCVLGFQSIAQVSSTYGTGEAQTIVENCGNTLILRCSASEQGGTARFASRLIGDREVIRAHNSSSRRPGEWRRTRSYAEQHVTEPAVLPSEIEQLPDLAGYLKVASSPSWKRVLLKLD